MSGIGYRIRRSALKKHSRRQVRVMNAMLLGQLQIAAGLLSRPFLGRLKWAIFKR